MYKIAYIYIYLKWKLSLVTLIEIFIEDGQIINLHNRLYIITLEGLINHFLK